MAITDAQIADLRELFNRLDAHMTELENRLIAVLDTVETVDADEERLAIRDAWAELPDVTPF